MENSKDINSIIKYLNKLGYKILQIEGNFYSISLFEEANQNNWKHTIEGKEINDLMETFVHLNVNDSSLKSVVINKIEECPIVHKNYHKDCKFIFHLK